MTCHNELNSVTLMGWGRAEIVNNVHKVCVSTQYFHWEVYCVVLYPATVHIKHTCTYMIWLAEVGVYDVHCSR